MSKRKTAARWMPLRCDASMQSPQSYGPNGYRVEPPATVTPGKVRCPVCWKEVKLMQRTGFGGRRIPAHNVDHEMVEQKEAALNAAAIAKGLPRGQKTPDEITGDVRDFIAHHLAACDRCSGSGHVWVFVASIAGGATHADTCPECRGTGKAP